MPTVIAGSFSGDVSERNKSLFGKDYEYEYPHGLDLRPGRSLHDSIVQKVVQMCWESYNVMQRRHAAWNNLDEVMTAFIPLSEYEKNLKKKDRTKPVSIVVPYSYAAMESILAYKTKAFLQNEVFSYEGVGPEDTVPAALLGLVINQQVHRFKSALDIHTGFRDGLQYGFHASLVSWGEKWGMHPIVEEYPIFSSMGSPIGTKKEKRSVPTMLFEGNKVTSIDPYKCLPDPNVSVHKVRDGEFFGWFDSVSVNTLLMDEAGGDLFNVKYLNDARTTGSYTSKFRLDSSKRDKDSVRSGQQTTTKYTTCLYLYATIIPAEWKLPGTADYNKGGEYPEKWFFQVGDDSILLSCGPLNLDHNEYPIALNSPDYDGYSIAPVSRMEMGFGLQEVLNWVFNCYDKDTEVLTNKGWVPFPQLSDKDLVSTVDPFTKELWFEKPSERFEYDYDDYMLCFKSSKMDMCVTPNHNMFGKYRHKNKWDFKPAAFIFENSEWDEFKTLGNINWAGITPNNLVIEGETQNRYPKAVIESNTLAGFLGWFLSEGSISRGTKSGTYSVTIKQSKVENYKDIDGIMSCMPFHVNRSIDLNKSATQWTISDRRLYRWLKDNCYKDGDKHSSYTKKIPDFVMNWDEYHLRLLFDRLMLGDGHWLNTHTNLGQYSSVSKSLIDGVQEIALKLGYFAHATKRDSCWYLNINREQVFPTIALRNTYKSRYKGKVYCFTNSTHLTITRRNGKIAIQGQSHIQNVRKAINDMFVVDPSLISMTDLQNPEPGKLLRLRRSAWGRGVDQAIKQLAVSDITRGNIADAAFVIDMMQKVEATSDAAMGFMRQGSERRSAAEFSGTFGSQISRLEHIARLTSLQYMQDLGYLHASHTQQLMSQETYVRAIGEWPSVLADTYGRLDRAQVDPFAIIADFDVVVKDGSAAAVGSDALQFWTQMLPVFLGNPMLFTVFDVTRIFKNVARLAGEKNVHDFIQKGGNVQAQLMGNEMLQSELQKGNLKRVGGGGEGD